MVVGGQWRYEHQKRTQFGEEPHHEFSLGHAESGILQDLQMEILRTQVNILI